MTTSLPRGEIISVAGRKEQAGQQDFKIKMPGKLNRTRLNFRAEHEVDFVVKTL